MTAAPDPILALLAECTVVIERDGVFAGTGFWVSSSEVMTCAHVVHGGRQITVRPTVAADPLVARPTTTLLAKDDPAATAFYPQPDIALVRVTAPPRHPCVDLDTAQPASGEVLSLLAYTRGEYSRTTIVRSGAQLVLESDLVQDGFTLLKLSGGQVVQGFSGGPVLNRRTGKVCAIIDSSRSTKLAMGGFGIPVAAVDTVAPALLSSNAAHQHADRTWSRAWAAQRRVDAQRRWDDTKHRNPLETAARRWIRREIQRLDIAADESIRLTWTPAEIDGDGDADRDPEGILDAIRADREAPIRTIAAELQNANKPKLAVLAPAGAGKTVASLHIALELLATSYAVRCRIVPVVLPAPQFAASGFDAVQAAELFFRSTLNVPQADLRALVVDLYDDGALAFIIDGLDEVAENERTQVLHAIDRLPRRTIAVLTSRPEEYREALGQACHVHDMPVVELGSAPFVEVRSYLERGGIINEGRRGSARGAWSSTLDALEYGPLTRHADVVRSVLSVPLYAWLARERYRTDGPDPHELLDPQRLETPDKVKGLLLDGVLSAKYSDANSERLEVLRRWYTHLARRFHSDSTRLDYLLQVSDYPRATFVVPAMIAGAIAALTGLVTAQPLAAGVLLVVLATLGAPLLAFGVDAARMFVDTQETSPPRALRKHSREAVIGGIGGTLGGAGLGLLAQPLAADPAAYGFVLAIACVALSTFLLTDEYVGILAPLHVPAALAAAVAAIAAYSLSAVSAIAVSAAVIAGVVSVSVAVNSTRTPVGRLLRGLVFFVVYAGAYSAVGTVLLVASALLPLSIATTGGLIVLACLVSDVAASRLTAAFWSSAVSVPVVLLIFGLVGLSGTGPTAAIMLAAVVGVGATSGSQWGQFRLSHWSAALRGDLPWRLERFLRDGMQAGLLSAVGTNYYFRHADLRERLIERADATQAAQEQRWQKHARPTRHDDGEAPRPEPDVWEPERVRRWQIDVADRHLATVDIRQLPLSSRTFDALRTLARSGDADAMGYLGLELVHAAESPSEKDRDRAMQGPLRRSFYFAKLEEQHDEGIQWLRRAVRFGTRESPIFEPVSTLLAASLANEGDVVEAERLLLYARGDSSEAIRTLAMLYRSTARVPQAMDLLTRLIRDRTDMTAMRMLADLQFEAGRDDEAEEVLRDATRLGDHAAARRLASVFAQSSRSKEAEEVLIGSASTGDTDSIIELCRYYADRRNAFHLRKWHDELTRHGGSSAEIHLRLMALEDLGYA